MTAEPVWSGPDALRALLVTLGSIEPWPGNPRRGDVAAISASLERHGQPRPIVYWASKRRIVGGHHVRLAALELGWTHIAAVPNEFADEEEARAFLLADNRTAELGVGNDAELAVQLAALSSLAGTGYTAEDAAELEAGLARLRQPATVPKLLADADLVLHVAGDVLRPFRQWVEMLEREWEILGLDAVVLRAVREAAAAL